MIRSSYNDFFFVILFARRNNEENPNINLNLMKCLTQLETVLQASLTNERMRGEGGVCFLFFLKI